jgi:2-hydroxychromene-2-carboxylate isomerase
MPSPERQVIKLAASWAAARSSLLLEVGWFYAVVVAATLEFWFEIASTYSYVAALRIEQACGSRSVPLVWKPFLLGPIFSQQLGIKDSPFNVNPVRGRYMWRDLERLCAKYRLEWRRPSVFPRNSVLAARVACAGVGEGWAAHFVRAAFHANFAEDRDIADQAILSGLLAELGVEPGPILVRAVSPEVRAQLRANTTEAMQIGIFGAPSFVVSGELFFGQDRLEDAVEWASHSSK